MIFKELKERKKQLTSQCLQKQHNTTKNTETLDII